MINKFQAVAAIMKNMVKSVNSSGNKVWTVQINKTVIATITKHITEKQYLVKMEETTGYGAKKVLPDFMKCVGFMAYPFMMCVNKMIEEKSSSLAQYITGKKFTFSGKLWKVTGYSPSSREISCAEDTGIFSGEKQGASFSVSDKVFMKNVILGKVKLL